MASGPVQPLDYARQDDDDDGKFRAGQRWLLLAIVCQLVMWPALILDCRRRAQVRSGIQQTTQSLQQLEAQLQRLERDFAALDAKRDTASARERATRPSTRPVGDATAR